MPRLLIVIKQLRGLLILAALVSPATNADQSLQPGVTAQPDQSGTQVILLGTGHPDPNPDRQGPG